MRNVRAQERADRVKFGTFLTVAVALTAYLVVVLGEVRLGDDAVHRADFDRISGLREGDQVRIAGVKVGEVTGIEVRPDSSVRVSFGLSDDIALTRSTTATVRYRNLIGDRILELSQRDPTAPPLAPGEVLGREQTASALDLDTLLNGFKPLFAGLNPAQVNALSLQLVQVLQGQSDAIGELLRTVGSVTGTVGQRQRLVSQVVTNLDSVLATVDDRQAALGELLDELTSLAKGLRSQDDTILDAASEIGAMGTDVAELLTRLRGQLSPALRGLEASVRGVNGRAATLEAVLDQLPRVYQELLPTAAYGNFFNFFLCGVRVQLTQGPDPVQTPWVRSDLARCR